MAERLVVVGGDAGGMTAASQAMREARRRGRELEVVAFERGRHVSYSACGIPYWVAGDVGSVDQLVARTAEEHRARGIDLRMRSDVVALDLDAREVEVRDLEEGRTYRVGFDQVVLATGADPVRPPVPGIDLTGVYGVQTLDDGEAVIERLRALDRGGATRRAVVVGAGYIGVEMAEALRRHGYCATLLDRAPEPMTSVDPDIGALIRKEIEGFGIQVRTGVTVEGFEAGPDGWVSGVVADGTTYPCDLVVLGIGVRPSTGLARAAGLPLGSFGGLRTDLRMAVQGYDGVWAAGDCVEVFDRVAQTWTHVPLGTHANKQGRVVGINVGGGYATFPGVVRTGISKVCALEIARTGLTEAEATRAGFRFVAATIESTARAGYMPEAGALTMKMLAEVGSGRLLGVQVVGGEDSAKRVDACAVALWNRMTVEEMTGLDLAYAPPYSPTWDPILVAARKAADLLDSAPG